MRVILAGLLEIVTDIDLITVHILIIFMHVMTILIVFLHLTIVHLHYLLEDFSWMNAHLFGNLQDLRVELFDIDVV